MALRQSSAKTKIAKDNATQTKLAGKSYIYTYSFPRRRNFGRRPLAASVATRIAFVNYSIEISARNGATRVRRRNFSKLHASLIIKRQLLASPDALLTAALIIMSNLNWGSYWTFSFWLTGNSSDEGVKFIELSKYNFVQRTTSIGMYKLFSLHVI